jgi:hypothetical protein
MIGSEAACQNIIVFKDSVISFFRKKSLFYL